MDKSDNQADQNQQVSGNGEQLQFDIDFKGLIDILTNHLYTENGAVIRELISNANDSLVIRQREYGFGNDSPAIRLWLETTEQQRKRLIIKDNGVGMSKSDLVNYLSTIGAGLARNKKKQYKEDYDALIGRFGVGFLASFKVAKSVSVETKKPNSQGYLWHSAGEREYTITELGTIDQGTTVLLDLKPEVSFEWTEEKIKRMVLENGRYFAFPIYWGKHDQNKLNNLQAPWYTDQAPSDDDVEIFREFLTQYDENYLSAATAMEIIPLYGDRIRGVVYIPPITGFQFEKYGLDLFCKRVLVTRGDLEILPEEFRFVKGIVDCDDFQLNLARDSVQKESFDYRRVGEFVPSQILDHFRRLSLKASSLPEGGKAGPAEIYRTRLQTVMDQFHVLIKNALLQKNKDGISYRYDNHYLLDFQNFMPFRSSLYINTTMPDYMNRMKAVGMGDKVLFLRPNEDYIVNRAISEQEKREFILVQLPLEEEYLKRYCQVIGVEIIPASQAIIDAIPRLPPTPGWDAIVKFYQERLDHTEYSLSVYLSEFHPETVPGRLLSEKESEGLNKLQEIIEELKKGSIIDKNDSVLKELERMKQKHPYSLYINHRNPVLSRLAGMLARGMDIDLDIILHSMFHDIAIAAGNPILESHLSEYQVKVYSDLLTALEARNESITARTLQIELQKNLEATQSQLREAQARNQTFERELEATKQEERSKVAYLSEEVFFIRSMHGTDTSVDFIARRLADVCNHYKLKLVDPKSIRIPGDILKDIIEYLRKSRFVIADVTEVENPNVFYEVGYVFGMYPEKLILIADKKVIQDHRLPFDINTQRILGYNISNVPEFEEFIDNLRTTMEELVTKSSQ
jgi:HSP90 family molecular chaperone